jgi:hypothetical protein
MVSILALLVAIGGNRALGASSSGALTRGPQFSCLVCRLQSRCSRTSDESRARMSDAGIHASMAALARCAAPIDAIAKVPSLRKDRVGGGRRRCGWVRLGRRRIAPCRWVLPGIQSPRSGSPCVISMTCKCPVRLRAHVPNLAGIPRLYLIDIREDCRMPHRSRLGRRTHLRRA